MKPIIAVREPRDSKMLPALFDSRNIGKVTHPDIIERVC